MFENFSDQARQVIERARTEARRLGHHNVGTEHLLLGLIGVEGGIGARVLASVGCTLADARQQVDAIIGAGHPPVPETLPFTPRLNRVLDLSRREALQLGHDRISSGHQLLGLTREGEGVGVQVPRALHVDLDRVRRLVLVDAIDPEPGRSSFSPAGEHRLPTPPTDLDKRLAIIETAIINILQRLAALEQPGTDASSTN